MASLGGLTGRSLSKNARIPFLIQGTTSDPKFVPDVGGIVESELGNALGNTPQTKGLGDVLGGFLGGKKGKTK
jgi:hypothetical protein